MINFFTPKKLKFITAKDQSYSKVYQISGSNNHSIRSNLLALTHKRINLQIMYDLNQRISLMPSARLLTKNTECSSGLGFKIPHRLHGIMVLYLAFCGYEAYIWPFKEAIFDDRIQDILVVKKKW